MLVGDAGEDDLGFEEEEVTTEHDSPRKKVSPASCFAVSGTVRSAPVGPRL
jgi:hypothetical protein